MLYRLYLFSDDGHIHHAPVELECRDDAHAIRLIQRRGSDSHMELWEGKRMVRTFNVPPLSSP